MQMYKGAPIITNKHPLEEREGVVHHVMNHVGWDEEYFIHRFSQEAGEAIDDIHSRGKLPIVVGGTHYYLKALLFNNKTIPRDVTEAEDVSSKLTKEQLDILDGPPDGVLQQLQRYDPLVAQKFHPNDTRRIRRALEIYFSTKKSASEHYSEQKQSAHSESSLDYNILPFWLFSEKTILDKRLDDRVDKMLRDGGMQEIRELYEYYSTHEPKPDLERGVWQVIGFKEFLPWLENGQTDDKLLRECTEQMKARTRQYAKKQVKWIKGMFASDLQQEEEHGYENGGRLYVLDATDLSHWNENVFERGASITEEFLQDKVPTMSQVPKSLPFDMIPNKGQQEEKDKLKEWKHITCEVCHNSDDSPLVIVGDKQFEIHLKSKRHRSNLNRGKRKREYEEWLAKKDKTTTSQ